MALSRLGCFIELIDIRNRDNEFSVDSLKGISINKVLTPTKANTNNLNLKSYKILKHNWFTYSLVTSRNGNKISLAYNDGEDCIVSSINPVFKVKDETKLLPRYLMMFFNRTEFDRYARFNSWGSARETFSWNDFCNIELNIPSIEIQKKYVAIYEAMLDNLKAYENKLEDIKTVFTGLLDKCKKQYLHFPITKLTFERKETNKIHLGANYLYGVGKEGFIKPKQLRQDNSLYKCNVFKKGDLVYNPSVLYAGAIALNTVYDIGICTEEYIVLHVCDEKILKPEFLFAWLKRSECGRFIDFKSVDSVRNRVYYKDLNAVEIPLPPINSQSDFVNIFNCYLFRKKSITKLKEMIDHICPILVKGAVLEAEAQNQ